jgi:hypothetical protein
MKFDPQGEEADKEYTKRGSGELMRITKTLLNKSDCKKSKKGYVKRLLKIQLWTLHR